MTESSLPDGNGRKAAEGEVRKGDDAYPKLLREISDPPERLLYKGNKTLLHERCIAVVGSRKCTVQGVRTAKLLAGRLAEAGVTIVSGLAQGIDEAAHRGALERGGNTIAVIANGLDVYYPRRNRELQNEIAENGLLLTEYGPGTEPKRYYFPNRNRIISGLCEGVIVVEAAYESGSLITADLAGEQGRDVYAVPGLLTAPTSFGCNRLLSEGAIPVFDVNDLLESLGLPQGGAADETRRYEGLSETEAAIVRALGKAGEMTADQLSRETGMPVCDVNPLISILELKGRVLTNLGKIFLNDGNL